MINRIRDIRKSKKMTLDDVARRCKPPTTPQTIGRLETGMRQLSLTWMNRIAAALEVDSELLVKGEQTVHPQMIARLMETGPEALHTQRDAILPAALGGDSPLVAMAIEHSAGEYRAGDQVWLRQQQADQFGKMLNRDVLAPRPSGRFAFGRMIDRDHNRIALLPIGLGTRQVIIDNPPWLAVAEMLVRTL